jgi:hypothetical protein
MDNLEGNHGGWWEIDPSVAKWFQVVMDGYVWGPIKENEHELWELLVPPTLMANSYTNMGVYDNHFQFAS